jgi:hypothetical protein
MLLLSLAACDNSRKQNKPDQEIPKALEDKSTSSGILSKRSEVDLVESLYGELLNTNQNLKKFESKIKDLDESKNDSTEMFRNFDSKNQNYYNAANRHIEQLSDSTLKMKIKILISNSLTRYNASTKTYDALLKSIEDQHITLTDLHTILKITKTLPLIEKYQEGNMPSAKPMEEFIQKQNDAIRLADTLSKK